MKLIVPPGNARTSVALDQLIESRLIALTARQRIEEATVRLYDNREGSPRYQAGILIRVPGPDIHAVACDHTLRGAVQKVIDAIEAQVDARRRQRRQRGHSQLQMSSVARTGRAW